MIFILSFQDFIVLNQKISNSQGIVYPPLIFYYISNNKVYLYRLLAGYVFCCIVAPSNLDEFQKRYLTNSYLLLENIMPDSSLKPTSIPEENPNRQENVPEEFKD